MAGRKTDGAGRPLLLRDNRIAARNFGMQGLNFTSTPKSKFMFYVRFLRADGAGAVNSGTNETESSKKVLDWSNGVGFLLKFIDRPKVTFDQQVINQYNKKRIVQTRAEYEPLVMRFHDTIDNRVYNLFSEYYRYYYGEPYHTSTKDWAYDITNDFLGAGQWGLQLNNNLPNQNYFFETMEIYQIYGHRKSYRFDLVHPKILSFDPDELDFANGGVGNEITMQLNFEGVVYVGESDLTDDQLNMMGLDVGDFFESEDSEPSEALYQKSVNQLGVEVNNSGLEGILRNTVTASTNAALRDVLAGRGVNTKNIIQNGIYNGLYQSATNTGGPLSSISNTLQSSAKNAAKARITDSIKALRGKI